METTAEQQISLVEILGNVIEKEISVTSKNRFLNLKGFEGIDKLRPHVQRILINRELTIELLKWRHSNQKPVYEVIGFLHNDGDASEWVTHFMVYVLPFLKKNNILGV